MTSITFRCLYIIMAASLFACTPSGTVYYVAPGGEGTGVGSKENPFSSISQALQAIQKERAKGKFRESAICFRKGEYIISNTVLIDSTLSYIRIESYEKEPVVFTGGRAIPAMALEQMELNGRMVFRVDLKKLGINDYGELRNIGFCRPCGKSWAEIFVDGKSLHLARWPNITRVPLGKIIEKGSVPRNGDYSNKGGIFICDSSRIFTWKKPQEAWITGYFHAGFADDALRIEKIDPKAKTIKTDGATLYGFRSGEPFNLWYAYNIKEELDEPGEYYIDRDSGELFFIPLDNTKKPEFVVISMLEKPFIDLFNTKNIKIKGITFECSRFIGITMAETENVVIESCTFRNLGSYGISMGYGIKAFKEYRHSGTGEPERSIIGSLKEHIYDNSTYNGRAGMNNGVINCKFYNLGSGGIILAGGDRITLQPGNNYVDNCLFHDNNRIERSYQPAINIMGVGNIVRHCEIYNLPGMAINIHGNNHLIENSYIHDVLRETDDMGAIYYGRDATELGNVIRHNFFANYPSKFWAQAIYQDDGSCGLTVNQNIFYKTGRQAIVLSGSDNNFTNNVVIDTRYGITSANHGIVSIAEHKKRLEAVNYTSDFYTKQYPYISNYRDTAFLVNATRNFVKDNCFINVGKLVVFNFATALRDSVNRISLTDNKEIKSIEFLSETTGDIINELIENGCLRADYNKEIIGRYESEKNEDE